MQWATVTYVSQSIRGCHVKRDVSRKAKAAGTEGLHLVQEGVQEDGKEPAGRVEPGRYAARVPC